MSGNTAWSYLDTLLIAIISFHVIFSPFTKVEESFTIQAIHDILKYGITDVSQYDHIQFPGVVPRSFIGPLVIAYLTKPFIWASKFFSNDDSSPTAFECQLLARAMIGLTNGLSLLYLKNEGQKLLDSQEETKPPEKRKQSTIGFWFLVFLISQFHLIYYSSRSLPNFVLALPLSNIAIAWALKGDFEWSIFLYAFSATVFRLELGAMCVSFALLSLAFKKVPLYKVIKFGIIGAGLGSGLTITVDSHFWQRRIFPEMEAFLFNIVQGQSSKWGTQSFWAYFNGYLLMMFLPPTVLFLNYLGFQVSPDNLYIVGIASYLYIFILSLQPHKEWRFIIYSVPPITLLGSNGASYLFGYLDTKSFKSKFICFCLALSPVVSFAISMIFLYISSLNYAGGNALQQFNAMIIQNNVTNATVHMDVPTCMTGATLFGQLNDNYGIVYDKTEGDKLADLWPSFDYLISAISDPTSLPKEDNSTEWELVQTTKGFGGINVPYLTEKFSHQYRNGFSVVDELFEAQSLDPLLEILKNVIIDKDLLYTYKKVHA